MATRHSPNRLIAPSILTGLLFAMLFAQPARAVNYTWTNTASGAIGYWTNSANWNPSSGYPGTANGDGANITTATANTYTNIYDTTVRALPDYIGNPLNLYNTGGGEAWLIITNAALNSYMAGLGQGARLVVTGSGALYSQNYAFAISGEDTTVWVLDGAQLGRSTPGYTGTGIYVGGGIYSSGTGTNCSIIVSGSGSKIASTDPMTVGKGAYAQSNSVWVLNGASSVTANLGIGSTYGTNSYNSVVVSDPGSYIQFNYLNIGTAVGSTYNSLTISNGASAWLANSDKMVGRYVGSDHNSLNIGGLGAAVLATNGYQMYIGRDGAAYNSMTITNARLVVGGNGFYVGSAAPSNTVNVLAGATWQAASTAVYPAITVGSGAATGNVLRVSGGTITNFVRLYVGDAATSSGNTAIFEEGGKLFIQTGAPAYTDPSVRVGRNGGTDNQLVINGGLVQTGTLTIDIGNSVVITNSGILYLGSSGITGSGTVLTGSGGLIGANGANFAIANNITLTNGTTSIQAADPAGTARDITLSGLLSGIGSLTKTGAGTLTLAAANTHSGDTVVSGTGQLRLNHVSALQNSTLDTGVAGAQTVTFIVGGNNTYHLGGLKGSDDLAIGGNTISVGGNGQNTAYGGLISGTGGHLVKVGLGELTLTNLTAVHSYTGNTVVNGGTLTVNRYNGLPGNGSDKVFIAPDADGNFASGAPTLNRAVSASSTWVGYGSRITNGTVLTTATLVQGQADGDGSIVSMQWRRKGTHAADVVTGSGGIISDVLNLSGIDAIPFALEMNYTDDAYDKWVTSGGLYLAWLNGSAWENAVLGNHLPGSTVVANYLGTWGSFSNAYSVTDATLGTYVGSWGVDTNSNVAWAVLDHNSQFAVWAVPEPALVAFLLVGGTALLARWRRRR